MTLGTNGQVGIVRTERGDRSQSLKVAPKC